MEYIRFGLVGLGLLSCWQLTGSIKQMQAERQTIMQHPHRPHHPIVIAHRGASGFLPEHTIPAYVLAIIQGADFIEPDLVPTEDGVLIARHENELSDTTDVANHSEFAERRTTKMVDGVPTTGWFSEDFSLAEIKTLRARERIPDVRPKNTQFDGSFTVPTFTEIIRLLKLVEQTTGRKIGIYPETKHPTYFSQEGRHLDGTPINLSLGQLLIDTLVTEDCIDPSWVFIQSFEFANLIELQNTIMPSAGIDLPLIQLYGDVTDAYVRPKSNFSRPYDMSFHATQGVDLHWIYGDLATIVAGGITLSTGYHSLTTQAVLTHIAKTYAEGIGPWKTSLVEADSLEARPFLQAAFDAGLQVHPYTFRAEETFLARGPGGRLLSVGDEIQYALRLGIHGFFTDHPNEGVAARNAFLRGRRKQEGENNP